MRDIRRRLLRSGILSGTKEDLVSLLALDPLTTLRCLRVAATPVHGPCPEIRSIRSLVDTLGVSLVRRALDVQVVDTAGTGPIRTLWLHSLASASAAQTLAKESGSVDPDLAYMLGLLHDLPSWLHYLGLHHQGEPFDLPVQDWVDQWHLPQQLAEATTLSPNYSNRDPYELVSLDDRALLPSAELMAELADFRHPNDRDVLTRNMLLSSVTKESLVLASDLRLLINQVLTSLGLGDGLSPQEDSSDPELQETQLFPRQSQGEQTELVSSLLQCSRATTYRGIVTVATSAALRYLDFERAYFIRWNRQLNRCWVKAKADLSVRPLRQGVIEPSAHEAELLQRALTCEDPQVLRQRPGEPGLLTRIGADSSLAVSLNNEFEVPTFLLLDRTLSGRPIRVREDSLHAGALGGMVSILADNLRMRLQRIRAQRFALIDPLTRLANRRVGLHALEREMARAHREGKPLTVLMLDLDSFKLLNDTHGHLVGDQALRMTATVLRKTLRKSDVVCRYGGEEFLVVLPDTTADFAALLATRLFTAVETAGREFKLPLTVSIGLSDLRESDRDTDSLVGRADYALYASKERGRNRFSVDTES